MISCLAVNDGTKFSWVSNGRVFFKGYLYSADDKVYSDEAALKIFDEVFDEEGFLLLLKKLNGFFSVIVNDKNYVYFAVDRVNSTPLMYRVDETIWVGDDYRYFLKAGDSIESESLEQYLASGYVYGRETLIKDIYQLLPGSALIYNRLDGSIRGGRYYEYLPPSGTMRPLHGDFYLGMLDSVHKKVFTRLINNLNGRQAVLPLSGGYDSRLILEMLLRLDYRNILCVTWGREDDWQVKIAKEVTSKVGVRWLCINQDSESWAKWYREGRGGQLASCGDICSISYIQENILISYLEQKGLIDKDSVFLNGNSGDFIEGEHIPNFAKEDLDKESVVELIIKRHARLAEISKPDQLREKLLHEVELFESRGFALELFFEYWEWSERQSKFVTNCVKQFEVCGYEWRMPFWENEIMDFWASVPVDAKIHRSLYYSYFDKYMNTEVLKPNPDVSFFRVAYERLADPRFGIFFERLYSGGRFFKRTSSMYSTLLSRYKVVKPQMLLTVKFNSLLALDTATRILEEISAKEFQSSCLKIKQYAGDHKS